MKRILTALVAAAALAVAAVAVPQKAEAHAWWVVPSIVAGTLIVGGAIIAGSHAHARAHGYGYGYYPGPHYAPPRARGSVYVAPARGCYLAERPTPFGYRYVEVCR